MSVNHPSWVADAIFYQIFPDRFDNGDPTNDPPTTVAWDSAPTRENYMGGDLEGVIRRLDYIQDLGCNAIYLNPIFKADTNHRYDTSDYYRIDPALGDDRAFDRLVREVHARDMRIVLDGVFNHCGLNFEPFQDVLKNGAASQYRNWFDVYHFPVRRHPVPNYATCGLADYLPRLNAYEPEVAAFARDVALHWLGRGIDGWRLDVPYEIHPDFWRAFRTEVKAAYPQAYLVAEEWRDTAPLLHGDTFDGATHYRLRELIFDYVLKNALTGEAFLRGLEHLQATLPSGSTQAMLTLLGSHDTERVLTAASGNTDLVQLAFTAMLTLPGAPLLYYGDENGMEGANDPGCRGGMEWDSAKWTSELRTTIKRLIHFRANSTAVRRGNLTFVYGNDRIAAYARQAGEETVLIVLNTSQVVREVEFDVPFMPGAVLNDLSGQERLVVTEEARLAVRLLPSKAHVLLRDEVTNAAK